MLGSSSLSHLISRHKKTESLAGRFSPIYVPHWSYSETKEAFGASLAEYALFGGYPKAMEFISDRSEWFNYVGSSIVNPIIDTDIFIEGKFKKIDSLRIAFKVFCNMFGAPINYKKMLSDIQSSGNIQIVKNFLEGYYNTFLISPVYPIDDKQMVSKKLKPHLMANCPAIYTFGRDDLTDFANDDIRLKQNIAIGLKNMPNIKTFGYWQRDDAIGVDFYVETLDQKVFGISIPSRDTKWNCAKSHDIFRKTFKNARIAHLDQGNFAQFAQGQRAFLESFSI